MAQIKKACAEANEKIKALDPKASKSDRSGLGRGIEWEIQYSNAGRHAQRRRSNCYQHDN